MRFLLLCLLSLLSTACATNRLFAPRENQNGAGPTGRPAAVYTLAAPASGEVRLWSDGCDLDEHENSVLHLGFELENTGAVPLVLDPTAVTISNIVGESVDGGPATPAATASALVGSTAPIEVAPHSTGRADLNFVLAGVGAPRTVQDFHVGWQVRVGDQTLVQVTPFQTYYPQYTDDYDRWPWWGFGGGFYWHRCR